MTKQLENVWEVVPPAGLKDYGDVNAKNAETEHQLVETLLANVVAWMNLEMFIPLPSTDQEPLRKALADYVKQAKKMTYIGPRMR